MSSAFAGLTAAHVAPQTVSAVLAEVALPSSIRRQQADYRVHPALLDACFQSVAAHPAVRQVGNGGLLLPLGLRRLRVYASTRNARYCHTTVTAYGTNVEADIDVMDEDGTVLLVARGLQMGTGLSECADRDRLLAERLLTIEWREREPAGCDGVNAVGSGKWLLVSISDTADMLATELTDALKRYGAECATLCWPRQADPAANLERLGKQLDCGGVTGVVVLAPEGMGGDDARSPRRGSENVKQLVRIARRLPEVSGSVPGCMW
ncbi:hypothetical protein NIIDMKKI_40580 [Mycobacterium kansasii]|uniref:PKS/mFAS DH domain-containing protein n=1 Tax=Mycobacterium kansasii TaxID=1768 RepID=A0A7G1IFZ8_MYCKA|nr:hypothetical protein NIIDMKKI_40580 [Mycobacterium kansasii]